MFQIIFVAIVFSGSTPQMQTKRKAQQKPNPELVAPASSDVFEVVYPQPIDMRKRFTLII
jgi:hypothetical protein